MKNSGIKSMESFPGRHAEAVIHILIWAFIIFVIWSIYWGGNALGSSWDDLETGRKLMLLVSFPVLLTLNAFWLIPRYLKRKKWLGYGLHLLPIILLLELSRAVLNVTFKSHAHLAFDFPNELLKTFDHGENLFGPVVLGLLISFGYRFSRDWIVNLGVIEKLKAEKAAMELAVLKSQVDPHFLFNTLNTLYALALQEKSENTAEGIAKLAALMRYGLHDSQQDFILLSREIDYLRKYLELQQLRASGRNRVEFTLQTENGRFADARIAPLLLLPLVENAFKYGISPVEQTALEINIMLAETTLTVRVRNSIIANAGAQESGGVGLQNVKNRLSLLYPEKHRLSIRRESDGGIFCVELEVDLAQ